MVTNQDCPSNECFERDAAKSAAPLKRSDGADASRRAIGTATYHPLSVRRFALAIKRMQRTGVHASTLARPPAADPQLR